MFSEKRASKKAASLIKKSMKKKVFIKKASFREV